MVFVTKIAMKKIVYACLFWAVSVSALASMTEFQYLSGIDKDQTVTRDFFCTKGMNSGKWSTIRVPSQWEQQGFGAYNYGQGDPITNEQGLYKYHFVVPNKWKGKKIRIVFEGSMTDTEVKINGKSAGPVHQGAFYQFKYDISKLLNYEAENMLEVTVSKESADTSVNRAERRGDYWDFGVEIQNSILPFSIISATSDLYLRLLTPDKPKNVKGGVNPPFPSGDISILNGISAIGTKFSKPEAEGPQSQKNDYGESGKTLTDRLLFNFNNE